MTRRLLVTGSRSITDPGVVAYVLVQVLHDLGGTVEEVIQGGAAGVDTLANAWATERGLPVRTVRPDKDGGKRAYLVRDAAMVDEASHVVAIWDGESRGTRFTKDYASLYGKLHSVWLLTHVLEELYG